MNDNVIDLNIQPTDQLKATVELMKRCLETWTEYGQQLARIRRAHYDAYIAEGFTQEQALILCQKVVM